MFSIFTLSCNDNTEQQAPPQTSTVTALKENAARYPDSLMLTEKLIEYYSNNGDYDSGLSIVNSAIQKDSDIAELWDMKATLHYQNEDTPEAVKAFETAIRIYPLPEYLKSLGIIYAQTKNMRAIEIADALVQANKASEKDALFIKGLYYSYTNNKEKAITLFDSCLRIDYTYMFAYREKAIILYEKNKPEDALQVLTRAVTVQNNFDEGYYWMGKCYEKLNQTQQAIESYQTALMYDKNFIEAKDALVRLGVRK